jgi:Zn-dependent protease
MDFSLQTYEIIASVLALLVAIIGHEIMHGAVAYKYGDLTAKSRGRLSINPLVHIDPIGSIAVPAMMYFVPVLLGMGSGFLFGWAKPVPINTNTVISNGGYNAAMQVSLAGIAYNFSLAILAAVVLHNISQPLTSDSFYYLFFYIFMMKLLIINVVLGVFNLIPIPQFDGAHFLSYLSLKYKINQVAQFFYKYERYGMVIVVIVLVSPLKDYLLIMPVQIILQQLMLK